MLALAEGVGRIACRAPSGRTSQPEALNALMLLHCVIESPMQCHIAVALLLHCAIESPTQRLHVTLQWARLRMRTRSSTKVHRVFQPEVAFRIGPLPWHRRTRRERYMCTRQYKCDCTCTLHMGIAYYPLLLHMHIAAMLAEADSWPVRAATVNAPPKDRRCRKATRPQPTDIEYFKNCEFQP